MSNQNFPVIPSYEVLELLAYGRNTAVFRGKHELSRRIAAIKILVPKAAANPLLVARLQLEAQALSRCNHGNIVTAYDFGITANQLPFLVLDFLAGKNLAHFIHEHGTLSGLVDFSRFFIEVCAALTQVHRNGVVHRDVRPANLMVLAEDQGAIVKLIDFGTARLLNDDRPLARSPEVAGEIRGTPGYMSPEQCTGRVADARSDIFSLGCTMYESLASRSPFRGANDQETIENTLKKEPPRLAEVRPDAVDAVPLISRCLAKNPNDRFQTVEDVARAITTLERINASS